MFDPCAQGRTKRRNCRLARYVTAGETGVIVLASKFSFALFPPRGADSAQHCTKNFTRVTFLLSRLGKFSMHKMKIAFIGINKAACQNGPSKLVVWIVFWSVYSSSTSFFLTCAVARFEWSRISGTGSKASHENTKFSQSIMKGLLVFWCTVVYQRT